MEPNVTDEKFNPAEYLSINASAFTDAYKDKTPSRLYSGLIYKQIPKVIAKVAAVGKDGRNAQQNYPYRKVDDCINALNPCLAEYGLTIAPQILSRERLSGEKSSNGKTATVTILHVRYRITAEDGSFITADSIGEGSDFGDKSTNKAMSMAFKYMSFCVFMIPTDDPAADAEYDGHADSRPLPPKDALPVAKLAGTVPVNRTTLSAPSLASDKQKAMVWAKLNAKGVSNEHKHEFIKTLLNKNIDELLHVEVDTVLKAIARLVGPPNDSGYTEDVLQ